MNDTTPAATAADPWATPSPAPAVHELPLRFVGSGSEYFRIWIVNLLFIVVTVGIYSAWAKVRKLQYFYRNTQLAGAAFDFHGSPLKILLGRVIAVALFVAYNYSFQFSPWAALAAATAAPPRWMPATRTRFFSTCRRPGKRSSTTGTTASIFPCCSLVRSG